MYRRVPLPRPLMQSLAGNQDLFELHQGSVKLFVFIERLTHSI